MTYCENCELNYNEKTSDTGKCPLCTKKPNSYLKKPKYFKGTPEKQSIRQGVYNLVKGFKKSTNIRNNYGKVGIGKRKVGRQSL